MSFRDPGISDENVRPDGKILCDGILYFDDGSLRGLGGITTWLAFLMIGEATDWEGFTDPQVVHVLSSLLKIPTTKLQSSSAGNAEESTIEWISRQNKAAKVQPITTYAWSAILKTLLPADLDVASTTGALDRIITDYNNLPAVIAANTAPGGSGSLKLDGRKKNGVGNWLLRCGLPGWVVVRNSTHDYPFMLGPYGEGMSEKQICFVGSVVGLVADRLSPMVPAQGEDFVQINWNLPLSENGQYILFSRMRSIYEYLTIGVPIEKKKKYRLTDSELEFFRNIIALFDQVKSWLQTRLGAEKVNNWEKLLCSGNLGDDDLIVSGSCFSHTWDYGWAGLLLGGGHLHNFQGVVEMCVWVSFLILAMLVPSPVYPLFWVCVSLHNRGDL